VSVRSATGYRFVLDDPRDDAPRLALAAEIHSADPFRARFLETSIAEARLGASAIATGWPESEQAEELYRTSRALLREHGQRWDREEQSVGGLLTRGLLGGLRVEAQPDTATINALEEWPILHVSMQGALADMPAPVRASVPRLASLELHGADDAQVDHLLQSYDLSTLRKLTLRGPLTEKSLHAICQTPLPMLEDLVVAAPGLPNPSEAAGEFYGDGLTHAIRSKSGEALEAKHGWKKYLHAVSRFSIYPYTLEVLDILPPLPDDVRARHRYWD
jgi:hypothetical protein